MLGQRLRDWLADRDESALEQWFGRAWVLRAVFAVMARRYRPEVCPGFRGTIVYEVVGSADEWCWTLDVFDSRAVASPGAPAAWGSPAAIGGAAATGVAASVRVRVADFVRIGAGLIDPAEPLLAGRASFTGDLGLAALLPEMFAAPTLS